MDTTIDLDQVEQTEGQAQELDITPSIDIDPTIKSAEGMSLASKIDERVETTTTVQVDPDGSRHYPSLYDTYGTTFIAIIFGIAIVSGVIGIVTYIYRRAKTDHSALTQFVTTMFALIAGIFIADKIIAGPTTKLLEAQESLKILDFIQQTCLMVFAYYFGTKAQPPTDGPLNNDEEDV